MIASEARSFSIGVTGKNASPLPDDNGLGGSWSFVDLLKNGGASYNSVGVCSTEFGVGGNAKF